MRLISLVLFCLGFALIARVAMAQDLTVFAAASLKSALDPVAALWSDAGRGTLTLVYAGTPALARQVEQGAPADVYIPASPDWMDYLDARGLIAPGTRRDLLTNTLVLVATGDGPDIDPRTLPERLGDERLAMALVDAVPAGVYGKAALTALGLWEALAPSVAQADNVRAALLLVARGEAPFGIVYRTDALAEPRVRIAATFDPATHPPILYPAAAVAGGQEAAARAFLDWLDTPAPRHAVVAAGFGTPPR